MTILASYQAVQSYFTTQLRPWVQRQLFRFGVHVFLAEGRGKTQFVVYSKVLARESKLPNKL